MDKTCVLQDGINEANSPEAARGAIVGAAIAAHRAYPQYEGHWEGWEWMVGRVTRRLRTKMGVAFQKDDVVLYRLSPAPEDGIIGLCRIVAYSVRNGIDTSLPPHYIRPF